MTPEHDRMRDQAAAFEAINRSMATIEFEPNGTIIHANQNFLDAVGYRLEEVRGKHHRIFCDDSFYRDYPDFWASLAQGELESGQFQRRRSDGSDLWLEATYNPVFDEQGRVEKVIKFASNITPRVEKAIQPQDAAALASTTATQTAANTGEATQEIADVIHTILDLSGGVENQIGKVLEKAVEGRKQVTEVESIVAEIQDGAGDVLGAIDEIGR